MRPGTCKRCQRGDEVWRNNRRGSALSPSVPDGCIGTGRKRIHEWRRWPATFPQWTPATVQVAEDRTSLRLQEYVILKPHVQQVVSEAVSRVVALARERRDFPDYFLSRKEYANWFIASCWREALRLVFDLRFVRVCLDRLPSLPEDRAISATEQAQQALERRRLLLWLYVDQLTDRQLAEALGGISPADARRMARQAYGALLAALTTAHARDACPFPEFPTGIGWP